MNEFLKLQVSNAHTLIWDIMLQSGDITIDELFDLPMSQLIIRMYHGDILNEGIENYELEEFRNEIRKLFIKAQPTKAIAESFELESWLDSSKRVIKEDRFNLYKKYLIKKGKGNSVEQLESETYKILDSCHNPNIKNRLWDRRGLVYGNVQSGKTANFIGLINRAFDHGYQIIIVLTGVTEDLRRQTQTRVNTGVLGIPSGEDKGISEFAGFSETETIYAPTSIKFDLSTNAEWIKHNITLNKKSIWVIKKNPKILEALIGWLHYHRISQGSDKILKVPFLIIDDEADNASIQSMTKKDYNLWELGQEIAEFDHENLTLDQERKVKIAREKVLKRINRNIRIILSLIGSKTFVGYTATPYSIINQKIEDIDNEVTINNEIFKIDENTELFPEHFIIPIKPGSSYLGVEKIFNSSHEKRLPLITNLSKKPFFEDIEKYFPSKRGEEYNFTTLPKSLIEAFYSFIVVIIVRKHRGHNDFNSMLIHTSHLTKNADYVCKKLNEFVSNFYNNLYSNSQEIDNINRILQNFKKNSQHILFEKYFGTHEFTYPDSISIDDIQDIFDSNNEIPFQIVSYHSSENDENSSLNRNLNYDAIHNNGERKLCNYIVIGGNRLSRGLTLEGLSISYFVRSSTRQDSLYQMARWFGYRSGYEDLIKIFLPNDQILWFESVYKLEENLRSDFEENNSDDSKILPRDAIIKMAYHTPDNLFLDSKLAKKFPTICDPNKLRNTRTQELSFFGTTKSKRIINDSKVQMQNIISVKELFNKIIASKAKLFDNGLIPKSISNNNINYTGVDNKLIVEFLRNQITHNSIIDDITALTEFITKNSNELSNWSVVLAQKPNNSKGLGDLSWSFNFYDSKNILGYNKVSGLIRTPNDDNNQDSLLFSKFLDKDIDNTFDIIDKSNIDYYNSDLNVNKANTRYLFRSQKKIPILIIYLVKGDNFCFPLYYITIPHIEGGKKVRYIIRNN